MFSVLLKIKYYYLICNFDDHFKSLIFFIYFDFFAFKLFRLLSSLIFRVYRDHFRWYNIERTNLFIYKIQIPEILREAKYP